jgi:hypothetical protein
MVTSVVVWILFELQLKIHFFIFVMLCHFYFFLDLRFYFALRGCFHHDLVLLVCAQVSHELSSFGFPVQSYFCCSDPSMSGLVLLRLSFCVLGLISSRLCAPVSTRKPTSTDQISALAKRPQASSPRF